MVTDLPNGPIVSTEWLAAHLDNPQVRVVDIRGMVLPPTAPQPHYLPNHEAYAAGHIPGAVFVDWTRDIINPDDAVPWQVAAPDQYAALMSRLGIGDDTLVVAYDDLFMIHAGRLLWTLRYYGHDMVRVLDGGFRKWQGEDRPLETALPSYPAAQFTPRPRPELRRTADQILASLGDEGSLLLDARAAAEFTGEQSRATRGGHIPGAQNLFYRTLLDGPYDTFATPEVLKARLAEQGIDVAAAANKDLVVYCNAGVSATVTALGLELAGLPPAAVYDGSWNEWGNDASRPVE